MRSGQFDDPYRHGFLLPRHGAGKTLALYPSPAGATESLLDLESWDEIVRDNPVLKEMEADTEALLVKPCEGEREYYLVPIDECFRLVGLIREYWHGLSGGAEVWEVIWQVLRGIEGKIRHGGKGEECLN